MKTWEMIKKLTENPEKEFTRKSDGLHIKTNEYGELVWDSGYQFLRLHHDWEEVKKPVDFITAIIAFHAGKDIYCINGDYRFDFKYKPYRGLKDIFGNPISSSDILNGKWYIE